ncbi:suppressor of fused domain protein [Brachybacterium sp. AOP3-A1-3]|uniref:suppressor of fused domain protein n=1 Tax=Brachybacterium sp. AOP3-A1-3 TaxID=3457699 RepID=UPI0040349856
MTESPSFPEHVFDAFGVAPIMHPDPIGGTIQMVEKRPEGAPITMITSGASRLPTDSGESVELAVEVVDGQQGAARVALAIVCDDMAMNRRVPPVGTPWRNSEPILRGTEISAILVTPSRWGPAFDEVRSEEGDLVGHVRTLRLLTDAEAAFVAESGWEALCTEAGSADVLLDVMRSSAVTGGGVPGSTPVFLSRLHAEHPPRWVTFTGGDLRSVTGLESDAYMNEPANHEIWSTDSFVGRYPWIERFVRNAVPGQTALFTDTSGEYVLEVD